MPSFLEQLHHRSVFRVAAGYVVVALGLIEVASIILPTFGAPQWVLQVLLVFSALGFPVALVLAWAYGNAPEGAEPDALRLTRNNMVIDGMLVALLAVLIGLTGVSYFAKPRVVEVAAVSSIGEEISIAVLAFRDLSQGQDHIHLAEGISEEILNALAQVPDLRVASRTTSFSFRDDLMPTAEINEVLNVAYILEGSVRISGNSMRITAQLIDTATDAHLWSNSFDRPMEDIFAVQDEVSNLILTALNVEMGTEFAELESDQGTESVEAYSAYLLGRHHMAKREAEAMILAVSAYEQAITIDPNFADAYAGLGRAYYLNYEAWEEGEKDAVMREALSRAISLDPDNAVAIATLSLTLTFGEGHLIEAGILARRAYELAPGDIEIMMTYANYLVSVSRFRDAYFLLDEILEMDPNFSPALTNQLGMLVALQRLDLGLQLLMDRMLEDEMSLDQLGNFANAGSMAFMSGDMETYERIKQELIIFVQSDPTLILAGEVWLASIAAFDGDLSLLREQVETGVILQLAEDADFWTLTDAAGVYLQVGEYDVGFEMLQRAVEEGDVNIAYAIHSADPPGTEVLEHPRWQEIMNMPQLREFTELQEAARAQGQWDPLTPEDLGELTN